MRCLTEFLKVSLCQTARGNVASEYQQGKVEANGYKKLQEMNTVEDAF